MNICFIHAVTKPEDAVEWRGFRFARSIRRTNRHLVSLLSVDTVLQNSSESQAACDLADLIVVQGRALAPCMRVIQRWKARDKAVVVDVDVAADLFGEAGMGASILDSACAGSQKAFDWALRLVDAALVPSRQMLDPFNHYTQAFWVPDYIDLDRYITVQTAPHDGIVVGMRLVEGQIARLTNCGLLDGLKHVCQARPELRLLAWNSRGQVVDLSQAAELSWMTPFSVNHAEWPDPLAYVDIGLAPLTRSSDIWRGWSELLEYMVMKIPWLASEGPAYYDLRSYGWLVRNNPGSWERVLFDMVDHLDAYRAEAAGEPFLFGISQGIDENVETLLTAYSKIYQRVISPEVGSYVAG